MHNSLQTNIAKCESLNLIWLTTIQFVELVTATCVRRLLEYTRTPLQQAIPLYTATSEAVFQRAESLHTLKDAP